MEILTLYSPGGGGEEGYLSQLQDYGDPPKCDQFLKMQKTFWYFEVDVWTLKNYFVEYSFF